jgi:hypothetical protein
MPISEVNVKFVALCEFPTVVDNEEKVAGDKSSGGTDLLLAGVDNNANLVFNDLFGYLIMNHALVGVRNIHWNSLANDPVVLSSIAELDFLRSSGVEDLVYNLVFRLVVLLIVATDCVNGVIST